MGSLIKIRQYNLDKMLMPKSHLVAIYENLFKEGVMVAEKDLFLPSHPALENIPNLHVIKALQSLKSRGYVEESFSWRHLYWRLTNEGIQYLREYLHLPAEIVPATLKKPQRAQDGRPRATGTGRGDGPKGEGSRDSYRKTRENGDKTGDAGLGAGSLQFQGGSYGRGKAPT